jgi:hypothetical protein
MVNIFRSYFHFTGHNTDKGTEIMPGDYLANSSKIEATFQSVNSSRSVTVTNNVKNVEGQIPSISPGFRNCVNHVIAYVYSRTPLIWTLVIRIANYPEQLGPSAKNFLTVLFCVFFFQFVQ